MLSTSASMIVAFLLFSPVTAKGVTLARVYFNELCHGSHRTLLLESPSSINSTAIIKARRDGHNYAYNINCELTILTKSSWLKQGILLSVRFTDFRENCVDKLTIYDEKHKIKEVLCGLQSYTHEEKTFTSSGKMTIEFRTGTPEHGPTWYYKGFQLTVTAYADYRQCNLGEFRCKNRRCISEKLVCDGHNHCGDNSDQQCGSTPRTTSVASSTTSATGLTTSVTGLTTSATGLTTSATGLTENSTTSMPNSTTDGTDLGFKENATIFTTALEVPENVTRDGTDFDFIETSSVRTEAPTCPSNLYRCTDGRCVSFQYICENDDCGVFFEQYHCPSRVTAEKPLCLVNFEFRCDNGNCVYNWEVCNGLNDCGDWSDEKNCPSTTKIILPDSSSISGDLNGRNELLMIVCPVIILILLFVICNYTALRQRCKRNAPSERQLLGSVDHEQLPAYGINPEQRPPCGINHEEPPPYSTVYIPPVQELSNPLCTPIAPTQYVK